jgi:anti-anti-sigma regulatory factor
MSQSGRYAWFGRSTVPGRSVSPQVHFSDRGERPLTRPDHRSQSFIPTTPPVSRRRRLPEAARAELFRASVDLRGRGVYIRCSGELNTTTTGILNDVLWLALHHASADDRGSGVVVDLSEVRFCVAAGVEVLLDSTRTAGALGVRMRVSLSSEIRKVCATLGVDPSILANCEP